MKSRERVFCALAVFAAMVIISLGLFETTVSGAGGDWGGQSLGGQFYPSGDNVYPAYGSNNSADGTSSNGSFWINLNPNTSSLQYANWWFRAEQWDTSHWTATCSLHGLLNSSEKWPQNQNWSQSLNKDGLAMSANLNFNCYEFPNDETIRNVQIQCLQLQLQLLTAPENQRDELNAQILALQGQLASMQQQDRKQTLAINGYFDISPTILTGSNFQYRETTDDYYSYPNGWDNPPVITKIPSWSAEYILYGRFSAPTLAEAQAMGAPYVQGVPEPSTLVLLVSLGIAGIALSIWRRRK
ncbi:MAG: PEP-CTERM sorting domain-containing protein [Candidatus Nealsonbacteria bacterium]|nr:PEP-CTERM sorting domain-containing protein [Candidatus Nealsonbacteria bacterium]